GRWVNVSAGLAIVAATHECQHHQCNRQRFRSHAWFPPQRRASFLGVTSAANCYTRARKRHSSLQQTFERPRASRKEAVAAGGCSTERTKESANVSFAITLGS